jgi:long-chain acyl-CoA synthetase
VTFWDVFAAVADRHSTRIAIEVQRADGLEQWTYAELLATAHAESLRLAAAGVSAGDRCAILADNDARWCAAYLAIFRLGAIVVPLDTNYSGEQVAAIVADASPRVLLVNDRLTAVAHAVQAGRDVLTVLALHGKATTCLDNAASRPGPVTDTAVILYTSGTTADPKGVMLSHANLLAERDAAFAVVNVSERDSVLGVLPLFHALAQLANLLLPLAVGARVVFLETLNSTELVRALAERQITFFACVPQFFYLIHQRLAGELARSGALTRLVFHSLLTVCFRLRRMGVNAGPVIFGRVHRLLGRQMRLFITGGSKFDPRPLASPFCRPTA